MKPLTLWWPIRNTNIYNIELTEIWINKSIFLQIFTSDLWAVKLCNPHPPKKKSISNVIHTTYQTLICNTNIQLRVFLVFYSTPWHETMFWIQKWTSAGQTLELLSFLSINHSSVTKYNINIFDNYKSYKPECSWWRCITV